MRKKVLLTGIFSSFLIANAYAIPGIDLSMGIGYTSLSPSGNMSYVGSGDDPTINKIDLENDLNLDNSKKAYAYIDIDLPVLPNLKLEYAPFQYIGSGTLSGIKFGDKTFNADVDTDIDFDQYELDLYYGLPIPIITPRIGVALKYLDGNITVQDSTDPSKHASADINVPIPMLYAGVTIGVPLIPLVSKFDIDLEGKYLSISGNTITELKALGKIKLLKVPVVGSLYAGLGYKYTRLKIDDLDVDDNTFNADFKFKGIIGEVGVEF